MCFTEMGDHRQWIPQIIFRKLKEIFGPRGKMDFKQQNQYVVELRKKPFLAQILCNTCCVL
jgi:hypothetical protein